MIFQSTFPRGERQIPFRQSTHPPNFNPRSRVGNDSNGYIAVLDSVSFQSTFPRGERPFPLGFHCQTVNFNPRSRVGNDLTECTPVSLIRFQSTFPRGERRASERHLRLFLYFNPRSRVGNDANERKESGRSGISIHVPAWGTTMRGGYLPASPIISIHVPAWGTT